MSDSIDRLFLKCSTEKLTQLASRIDACLDRLTPEQVWARGSEAENAIGNLVLHLCGNLGQWILSGVDGQPDARNRDAEFAARNGVSVDELRQQLSSRVADVVAVIAALSAERLSEIVRIQKYELTVLEAVYHVVEHFAQHTGQIIFATKFFTGEDLQFYRHLKSAAPHREITP
jgi:uncharacterized damage-inducible protein DinB